MRIEPIARDTSLDTGPYFGRRRIDIIAAAQRLRVNGRLLDVGCASGLLGESLLELGYATEVVGIEIAPAVAKLAEDRLTQVIIGDANQEGVLPDGPFDGAILADVLEHQAEPDALLKRVVERLRPGSGVVISVPNVRHFRVIYALVLRNEWTYTNEGICDRTHLRFFTLKSFVELIANAGLSVDFCLATTSLRGKRVAGLFRPASTFLATQFIIGCRLAA